jgi:hypothetical protein
VNGPNMLTILMNNQTVVLIPILSVQLRKLGINTMIFLKDSMTTKRLKNFSGPTKEPKEDIVDS